MGGSADGGVSGSGVDGGGELVWADETAVAAAVEAVAATPQRSAVALAGPAPAVAEAAERVVAALLPDPGERAVDGAALSPQGPRWTVDEVRERVAARARRRPRRGAVIAMLRADLVDPPARDRLLKVLEEPAARVRFVLGCDDVDELAATIAGRCADVVRVRPAPAAQRAARMARRHGVDEATAAAAVAAAGDEVGLADALVAAGEVRGELAAARVLPDAAAATWARRVGDAVDAAAALWARHDDAPRSERARYARRVRAGLEAAWRAEAAARARASASPAQRRAAAELAAAVDAAAAARRVSTPTMVVAHMVAAAAAGLPDDGAALEEPAGRH